MGWIADTFTDGGFASVGYMLEGVHPPEKWDPPTTRLSSLSFSSISLRVFKLPVIAFLHLNRAPTIGPVLLMVRACHHADDLAVTWGTASLLPREQREPVYYAILPIIRRTDAVVASGGQQKEKCNGYSGNARTVG
jgi:hypothetical protein